MSTWKETGRPPNTAKCPQCGRDVGYWMQDGFIQLARHKNQQKVWCRRLPSSDRGAA